MEQPGSPARAGRIVTKIVLTYTDEATGEEKNVTLTREQGGVVVDGLIWNRALVERIGYTNGQEPGRCRPAGRRRVGPGDGWTRKGGSATGADDGVMRLAAAGDGSGDDEGECVWLHLDSCEWMSWCDPE